MNEVNRRAQDSAPLFNIKAVVAQTGLNPATLRAWERRYGFPQPLRTAGGHRQYSQRDIDTLKWLVARQEEGISISHAIELWRSYVDRGEDPFHAEATAVEELTAPVARVPKGGQVDELRQAWVAACLAFDRKRAEQVLTSAFALFGPETVCVELLQKGLAEVGNGWYLGKVTVQQEHFTSALSNQRLEMLIAAVPPPTRLERIIVATAPGDHHVFGPLLLTFLLRRRGWDVIYLGADVPVNELESTVELVQPELVIVSAQLLHTAATLKEIAPITQAHDVILAFGGLVFNEMPGLRQLVPGHFLGESVEDAVQWVAESMVKQPLTPQGAEPSDNYQRALIQFDARRGRIESHIWDAFIADNKPTEHLLSMNHDLGQTIEAALGLGDLRLLGNDSSWIEYLLVSYRPPKSLITSYLQAYYQAARTHLDQSATIIVDWLEQIATEQVRTDSIKQG